VRMLKLSVIAGTLISCILAALPLYAVRRADVSSSKDGVGTLPPGSPLCPNSLATPFFAPLDGSFSPPSGCIPTSDPNKPNPPAVYPKRTVVLSGTGFTVTVTPALWERGDGASPIAGSKQTIFQVQFSGQSGMTLESLVIGTRLNNAAYVPCDPMFPTVISFCMSSPLLNPNDFPSALEPAGIDWADVTTTRWDFSQFSPGGTLDLVVSGFPSEFKNIDKYHNSNSLAPTSFAESNFLATVKDASNNTLTAGGLVLETAPAATNDLFANAINISKVPFHSFINTSAANPSEILSGTGAGGEVDPQSDPIPQDPTAPDAGTPCSDSWSTSANRVFRSVWYKFAPAASNNYQVSTQGSRYDTGVYVFTGSPSSPTTIACNDDPPTTTINTQGAIVNFSASAGKTYFIMVSEVPPLVGVDGSDNPLAAPLATDATLKLSLSVGTSIVLVPNTVLNFPSETVGVTSQPIVITATNNTSESASVSKVSISGGNAKDFNSTNTCGTTIGPGAHCTISVTFTPLSTGTRSSFVQLILSGAPSPTPLILNGFGD